MSLVTLASPMWFPSEFAPDAQTTAQLLDSDADRLAQVFRWPKTGIVDSVAFQLGTATTPAPLRVSLQDVNASGDPDEVDDQYGVIASPTANTWVNSGKLTAGNSGLDADRRSVTVGELGAIVVKRDGAGTIALQLAMVTPRQGGNQGYGDRNLAGSYVKSASSARMAVKYSDGYVFVSTLWPIASFDKTTIGGSGFQRALRFKLPFAGYLGAVAFMGDFDGQAKILCYDPNNVEMFAAQGQTPVTVGDPYRVLAASDWGVVPVPPIRLEANTGYYLAFEQVGATATALEYVSVADETLIVALPGGSEFYAGYRTTSAAGFTDSLLGRPQIYVGLTQIEVYPLGLQPLFAFRRR